MVGCFSQLQQAVYRGRPIPFQAVRRQRRRPISAVCSPGASEQACVSFQRLHRGPRRRAPLPGVRRTQWPPTWAGGEAGVSPGPAIWRCSKTTSWLPATSRCQGEGTQWRASRPRVGWVRRPVRPARAPPCDARAVRRCPGAHRRSARSRRCAGGRSARSSSTLPPARSLPEAGDGPPGCPDLVGGEEVEWAAISNLDAFFVRIYRCARCRAALVRCRPWDCQL